MLLVAYYFPHFYSPLYSSIWHCTHIDRFLILSQVHIVQTPQGEDYEGKTFHGKRVSELHLRLLNYFFYLSYFKDLSEEFCLSLNVCN